MSDIKPFPVGKLKAEILASLLDKYVSASPRVLVGPQIGEDAAVIDMNDRLLVVTADPITFATDAIGWYAVHINANDIATMGARPLWFLPIILLPEATATSDLVEQIFRQIHESCTDLGITVVGGHTEITYGLNRPIIAGSMLGEVARDRIVSTAGARVGDDVLLTKGIAIEGTAVIAREKKEELSQRGIVSTTIQTAQALLHSPGISVVRDALIAVEAGCVHSMHDPTEGGLATGLRELAMAAGVGLLIEADSIPVLPETRAICDALGLDVHGLLASGCLVITCDPSSTDSIICALHQAGTDAIRIGKVTDGCEGLTWIQAGKPVPFPRFPVDEIARIFA